jgi:sugar phosphate isomerase/epimerase
MERRCSDLNKTVSQPVIGSVAFLSKIGLTIMVESGHLSLPTRRQFTGALAALTVAKLRAAARIPVAVQLFSLRTQCEQDPQGTLRYVREVGFEGVELAGYYGRTAAQWKELLQQNSLRCCGSHTPLPELTGDRFQATVENNRMLGNRYLIIPGLPEKYQGSAANWKAAADVLNETAAKLQPLGMRVGYHNHAAEFHPVDGVLPWAILYEHTRPEVILQLDTGNARIGGADPIALVREYPHREVTVHVKDYLPERNDPVIGSSHFKWKQFLQTCESSGGTEWYIIEHDSSRREEIKACFDRFQQFRTEAG